MRKKNLAQKPKRTGTAFWLADADGDLVRAIAAAEDRTIQAVLRRALVSYAEKSAEYQRYLDMIAFTRVTDRSTNSEQDGHGEQIHD